MADALDDFFAKKDKTKKKSKTKGLADVDADGKAVKKEKKKKNDKQNYEGLGLTETHANFKKDDEEWVDFEEEKQVDYTGLRIQNMQIAKEEQEKENVESDEDGNDEDGENRERKSGTSGPWKKSDQAPTPVPKSAKKPEPVVEESPAPKGPSKYVPPSMRNASVTSSNTPSFPSRRKKEAPNVNSEEDFPTLGGGPGGPRQAFPQYSNRSDFIDNTGQRQGVKLTLENRFSSLQD